MDWQQAPEREPIREWIVIPEPSKEVIFVEIELVQGYDERTEAIRKQQAQWYKYGIKYLGGKR